MNSDDHVKIKELWSVLRDKKPLRQGIFVGEEGEKFYVAKNEQEIYELSALVYYVWLICDGEHTVEQLVERMSKDIQVDKNELLEPILLALEGLSKVDLIKLD